jgi:TPR repeat protein
MRCLEHWRRWLGTTAQAAAALTILAATPVPCEAARQAFMVGVGDYDPKKGGLARLNAPAFDAEALAAVLRNPNAGFSVEVLTDEAAKDKATVDAALKKFLEHVNPGDEVVFYFSGHGINLGEKGNFFLLLDTKDQEVFIREERKKPGGAHDLETQEKENKRYEQYLLGNALSEDEVEKAIRSKGAVVVIIIADACRTQLSGAKGLVPVNGLKLPSESAEGTFRLYAAKRGQVSYDSPENALIQTAKRAERSQSAHKGEDKERRRANSLFTGVLLSQLVIPRQEINILFSRVKLEVRERALSLYNKTQVPEYDDSLTGRFYFWTGSDNRELAALCSTADQELERLRRGVADGSVFAENIEPLRNKLAQCSSDKRDYVEEINNILKLQEQGGGGTLANVDRALAETGDPNDPLQQCDARASSPLDINRRQGIAGVDLLAIAIEGRANEERRILAVDRITRALTACETAVREKGRVARYKFNLGSAHYAMATMTDALANKTESLVQASRYFQDAVDLGYPAAYNALALMHQHGEFHDPSAGRPLPANRQKARELLQRGADLGHVLALYHLGLAYKNRTLGLDEDTAASSDPRGGGKAFQYLSKAAESGFVPAMIETALAFKGDWGGVPADQKRAIELLEIAASRGSFEAMYQLGVLYDGARSPVNQPLDPVRATEALIWYARAAEAGDTRSQERLADMLTDGEGLPAVQREAAGRYWRLAADGGSTFAQMRLAKLLSEGKLPFRPKLQGKPDGGAEEIRRLYSSAFANHNPLAGLELARLFRTGFPKDRPSEAIPKSPEAAVNLLWATMDTVRQARPTSAEADPMIEIYAGFELLAMQEAGEAKRSDTTQLIDEDQVDQLRTDYGEGSTIKFLDFNTAAELTKLRLSITCASAAFYHPVAFWSWKRSLPPTDPQFEWFERYFRCHEEEAEAGKAGATKDAESTKVQGLRRIREFYRKQYEAWSKERQNAEAGKSRDSAKQAPQSFTDRIAALLSNEEGGRSRRHH